MQRVEYVSDLTREELKAFNKVLKKIIQEVNSRLYLAGKETISK